MFDTNNFKRSVKEWVKIHPQASATDLVDYCEELIPPQQYASHSWLIEQTVGWYKHVLDSREHLRILKDDGEEDE